MTALCDLQEESVPAAAWAPRREIIAEATVASRAMQPPLPTRIVLTGFMGAGKSTVGALLAAQLGWHRIDIDEVIALRTGRAVHDIFEKDGEFAFRRLETAAIAHALGSAASVIALGGGAVEVLANRLLLEQTPRTAVVLLDAPLPDLLERCRAAGDERSRPNLSRAEERFAYRAPLYRRVARLRIPTAADSPSQTALRVLRGLGLAEQASTVPLASVTG